MNLRGFTFLGMTATILGLGGCGSAPVKTNTQALAGVHTVAIIKAPEPVQYTVINKGSLAGAFGAVGGAAIAVEAHKDQKGLLGALAREHFSFANRLTADLEAALHADGYRIKVITVKRDAPNELLKDHASLMGHGVDAVLDIATLNVGYTTENWMTSPFWRPEARVEVALYERNDGKPVYDETYMYGYHNPFMSGTNLDAPRQYRFKDKDALDAASDRVLVGGLKDAAGAIAKDVAARLARK